MYIIWGELRLHAFHVAGDVGGGGVQNIHFLSENIFSQSPYTG